MIFFFFNDTATTEIYTLSLHDALPIWRGANPNAETKDDVGARGFHWPGGRCGVGPVRCRGSDREDRKSTRLNSSHSQISYAVFCLEKKKAPTPRLPIYHYAP